MSCLSYISSSGWWLCTRANADDMTMIGSAMTMIPEIIALT